MTENSIILILLIALMIINAIISVFSGKEEKTIFGTLISSGIALIMSGIPELSEMILGIIASMLNSTLVDTEEDYKFRVVSGIILIIAGVYFKIKVNERIYVLNMYGVAVQKDIDEIKAIKDLHLSEYKIKEQVIDFIHFFDGTKKKSVNNGICNQIEQEVKKFCAKATNQKNSCFTGMSPIPYTIYAGTFLENAKISRYFEYCNTNGGYYYELKKASKKEKNTIPNLKLSFPTNPTSNATEIVLAISISHKVSHQDLLQFSMDIVDLSLDNPMDNVIRYTQQLDSYKQIIYKCIETELITQYPHLKTIHIAASIPSCMSIEIGKSIGMRTNRVQNIVVHHYIRSNNPPYSFGLYVSGSKKGQLYN